MELMYKEQLPYLKMLEKNRFWPIFTLDCRTRIVQKSKTATKYSNFEMIIKR